MKTFFSITQNPTSLISETAFLPLGLATAPGQTTPPVKGPVPPTTVQGRWVNAHV